jgi:ankyrin repeat domain-containing protein 50
VRDVLAILVKQTVERHSDCAALARSTLARHFREETVPTEAELLQLLRSFTDLKAVTFYVLDALDEAPRHVQLDLVQRLASLRARVFITSRPLDFIEVRFPAAHVFSIVAKDADLDLHIAQEISRSPDLQCLLQRADPSLEKEITSTIKAKCGGM